VWPGCQLPSSQDFCEVPDDLASLSTDDLVDVARQVGAHVYGDTGREMIIQRIRKMALL